MLFQVKANVKLDDHGGQHQQANSCNGDEETCTGKIHSYFGAFFFYWCANGDGRMGFTKGVGCA